MADTTAPSALGPDTLHTLYIHFHRSSFTVTLYSGILHMASMGLGLGHMGHSDITHSVEPDQPLYDVENAYT